MRKTLIGALVLVVILAAILINNYFLTTILDDLTSIINEAELLAESGDSAASAGKIQEAVSFWQSHEKYFKSFMRHSETDSTIFALLETANFLECGLIGNFEAVYDMIKEMAEMEKISILSIF